MIASSTNSKETKMKQIHDCGQVKKPRGLINPQVRTIQGVWALVWYTKGVIFGDVTVTNHIQITYCPYCGAKLPED